jgi:hypothetical protein
MEMEVSDQLYATKPLEGASKVLLGDLRLGSGEVGLKMADGDGRGGFNSMVEYRAEELVGLRVEDGSGGCCTCV